MSIKRIVAANAAPIDAPSTINKLKFNGSSEALKPRLQFKSDRNQNRPELKTQSPREYNWRRKIQIEIEEEAHEVRSVPTPTSSRRSVDQS